MNTSIELTKNSEDHIKVMICDKYGSVYIDPYHEVEIDRPFIEKDVNTGALNLYLCKATEDLLLRSFDPKEQWGIAQQMLKAESEKYFLDAKAGRIEYKKQF